MVRRRLLVTLVVAASLAALASAAASPPPGLAVPDRLQARSKEHAPLLGTVWNVAKRRTELVHVDPVSLQTLPAPVLGIGTYGTSWAYSPDRERLAIATHFESRRGFAASLQILDPATLRRQLALPLGPSGVRALAWLEPDRVVLAGDAYHPERLEVLRVAPSAKRVLATTKLEGQIAGVHRTRDALVLLLSPRGRIGAATLVGRGARGRSTGARAGSSSRTA
jgi:hypothetical protein